MKPIFIQHLADERDEIGAILHTSARTPTHRFDLYCVWHDLDTKAIGGHVGDLEGVLVVSRVSVEAIIAQAHRDWTIWRGEGAKIRNKSGPIEPASFFNDRPEVWIEAKGHGIHGRPREGPRKVHDNYETIPLALWADKFTQTDDGTWRRAGASAPWSWWDRNLPGPAGEVFNDPARFALRFADGWGPWASQYTHNDAWEVKL